ncbi:ubiquitin carboxyl-terminal hydrolase-domain-containing protein [Kalaharituber pfeilii]|nr:ubiquitin carboxyl-terminal hydrolase-domain-containing protein [Kalaharituber pfeilii]
MTRLGIPLPEPHDKIRDLLRGKYASGDAEKAVELLLLHDEATVGIVKEVKSKIPLLGAENNGKVTCYLDSLLFALFARLDSFEAMLYNIFDDEPRRRMSTMIRLFVNLLRSGKLVTTDIMQLLQDSIATCGWADAATLTQQDASEAFTFITEKLDLPLLTLKMDVAHGGKEAADDDHRFISERLLNLAIPDASDGESVKLESCLESYFSNRIEVRRELERRATIDSMQSFESSKGNTAHVETTELGSNPTSPISPSAVPVTPVTVKAPPLIRRSTVNGKVMEAMVPAWCFFSVLPFYTEGLPNEHSSFTQHFATKRPVLGLCLKRYAWTPRGQPIRKDTKVEIPLEIPLPQFVSDDEMDADAPVYGNFKLVLKSAVCHRGNSVWSGHYIALVRGDDNPEGDAGRWLRFDDLAAERVTYVDYEKAFDEEMPYLLFYQVAPIAGEELVNYVPDDAVSAGTSIASLASSLGEKSILMPEIFAPTPEEARTPPPEYSATPPFTPGQAQRPNSSGYLDPEDAERHWRSDKTDGPISRRLWKSSSKEKVHDRSSSTTGMRVSVDLPRDGATIAEKREKRSSMPSLSILTGRRSHEWRRGLDDAIEKGEKKVNGDGGGKDGAGEKMPLKKSKSKDSPIWGSFWGDKKKDKERDKEKDKEKQQEKAKEESSEAVSITETIGGSSGTEDSVEASTDRVKEKDKGKEKEKEKGKSNGDGSSVASSSWKRLSKLVGWKGERGEKGESSSKGQKVEMDKDMQRVGET